MPIQTPKISFTNEKELKRLFASAWLDYPNDPFKAALVVCEDNVNDASFIAGNWLKDPIVLWEKEALGELVKALPTKDELARDIYHIGIDKYVDAKDRVAAFKLYAELHGYIIKPSTVTIDDKRISERELSEEELNERINSLVAKTGIIKAVGRESPKTETAKD